ncbi:MAG TPA: hypothetical protein VM933_01345, partial [Acidimicrobiales bacterium]|nr:hypothetical protein [Acidimicrobiales bacterium]
YDSPAEGRLRLEHDGGLSVDGEPVPISGYPRMANPWTTVDAGQPVVRLADDHGVFVLDLDAGTRRAMNAYDPAP